MAIAGGPGGAWWLGTLGESIVVYDGENFQTYKVADGAMWRWCRGCWGTTRLRIYRALKHLLGALLDSAASFRKARGA